MVDDAYTRNEDGELAVRTVSTSGDTGTNPNDVFTRDDEGRLAIRTTGGGGDQHNLGYFATQAALEEAHPTAEAGDWAIVGATDTVWLWDSDNSQWVDSDQKGQVTSVNGQTGTVVLTASDVGALPSTTPIPDFVQYSTMPTASADNLGDVVQFTGTTDANYTNGYFYKCTSAGDPVVYSWTQVDVQPTPIIPDPLPSQTGQSGKFLTTDGTDASWSDKPLVNTATGISALSIGSGSVATSQRAIAVGSGALVKSSRAIGIGSNAGTSTATNADRAIAIGAAATATAIGAIQLGVIDNTGANNSDANTFKVANANGNYEIMSADGTIPADRLTHAINKYSTMPTASASNAGWIVQFTGTTDSTYTHGYLYECKAQGTDPETYAWEEVSLGGASYTAGSGISITNNEISVTAPTLQNTATGTDSIMVGNNTTNRSGVVVIGKTAQVTGLADYCVVVGDAAKCSSGGGVSLGTGAETAYDGVAIGRYAKATGGSAIQIGARGTNSVVGTLQVSLSDSSYVRKDYRLLDYDGTIPEARLADTTNAQQGDVLTLDSNGNAVWQAGGGGSSYTAGNGISINANNEISVAAPTLVNTSTLQGAIGILGSASNSNAIAIGSSSYALTASVAIGQNAQATGIAYTTAIGSGSAATSNYSVGIGAFAKAQAQNAIQIGSTGSATTNSDANTFKVANANGNFELMDASGNLPADRLASTTGLADGNYRLRCTITNGVPTLSWVAE